MKIATYTLSMDLPIFSPELEDPNPQKRADRIAEKSYKDEQLTLQRKILWTQVGLVVFGLFGIGLNLWQADISQESADTAEKSVLLAQRSLREQSRDFAITNEGSRRALQAAIDQFKTDQRAWVSITSVKLSRPYSVTSPGRVTIGLANTGKTPAIGARIARAGFALTEEVQMNPSHTIGVTQPPGSTQNTIFLDIPPMSEARMIYIRFELEYRDVFQKASDKPHITSFCGFYPSNQPPFFFDCEHGGSDMD